MNLVELDKALHKTAPLRHGKLLETRLLQAQTEQMAQIGLLAALVSDELQPREDRLIARRNKHARFRDPGPLARRLRLRLQQEDQPHTRLRARHRTLHRPARRRPPHRPTRYREESSCQAIGRAAIQQGYRDFYRETHAFLEELAEATLAEARKDYLAELARAHLLIIDDLGMRKLPAPPPRTCSS